MEKNKTKVDKDLLKYFTFEVDVAITEFPKCMCEECIERRLKEFEFLKALIK